MWHTALEASLTFCCVSSLQENKKAIKAKDKIIFFISIFYKLAEKVSTSLLILFTKPTNTLPGPTSVKLVAPSAII